MPVKPDITKNMIRAEIDEQISAYLADGGAVSNIEKGTSGRPDPRQALPQQAFNQPRVERTPVADAISNVEARKHPTPKPKTAATKTPKKEMLLDDFGEPLRWAYKDKP